MKHFKFFISLLFFSSNLMFVYAQQYDEQYVNFSVTTFEGDKIGLIDMSREGGHVKVKYFAGRDIKGTLVSERYKQWAMNKRVIAYSSGTYMTTWDPQTSKPVGLCIDNGDVINNTYERNRFDGLAVVYATGGIAVSNLKNGDFKINEGGVDISIDPNNTLDRNKLINWGKRNGFTVFQTHLFYYKDQFLINSSTSKNTKAERRFLAVGYDENKILHHYIVNIPQPYDIYTGTEKAVDFLKTVKEVKQLMFLLNLDTGGQNVFNCFKKDGSVDTRPLFTGVTPLENACNLLVYYYE